MSRKTGTRGEAKQAKRLAGTKAFTFTEVLVAAAIMGMTALSLFGGFSSGFAFVQSSRENLRATQIMMQKVETIRLYTWTQMLDTTNYLKPSFTEYYDPQGATTNAGGTLYTGVVSSSVPTNLPGAYRDSMRTITVTVYWTNKLGRQTVVQSRQMQTQAARFGMQNYVFGPF